MTDRVPEQPRSEELTYGSYLRMEELLSLQRPVSDPPEHDEMLFIVFHQITELWFKQLLHELDLLAAELGAGRTFAAMRVMTRVRRILKAIVAEMDVLETLTPLSFGAFRDRLDRASGFQSMQFRELEFLFGNKDEARLDLYPGDLAGLEGARRRLHEPSIVDRFYDLLVAHGLELPPELADKPVTEPTRPNETVQAFLLERYVDDRELRILFELMTDIDEGFQEWRYRHVKLVERTIGNKPGTGGSLGVRYLRSTLHQPIFPDLWAIRHLI